MQKVCPAFCTRKVYIEMRWMLLKGILRLKIMLFIKVWYTPPEYYKYAYGCCMLNKWFWQENLALAIGMLLSDFQNKYAKSEPASITKRAFLVKDCTHSTQAKDGAFVLCCIFSSSDFLLFFFTILTIFFILKV